MKPKKYLLIEHGDGSPSTVHICDTPEQRERLTVASIFGDGEEHHGEIIKSFEILSKTGRLDFEGDPSVEWMDAYCVEH